MAKPVARKRSTENKGLEPYVKRNGEYYNYLHPVMRQGGLKAECFGRDKAAANAYARQANAHFSGASGRFDRMLSSLSTAPDLTLGQVIDKFEASYHLLSRFPSEYAELAHIAKHGKPREQWSYGYTRVQRHRWNKLKAAEGHRVFADLRVPEWEGILTCNFTGHGLVAAKNLAIHFYAFAIGKGLTTDLNNYPEMVLLERRPPRKRKRIADYAEYLEVRAKCPDWLQDAMDISLLSPLGRSEVCRLERSHIRREGDKMIIGGELFRQKTGVLLEIEACDDLKRVINRCLARAMKLGCPYVLCKPFKHEGRKNHEDRQRVKTHRAQVLPTYITNEFRKHTGRQFHEIRSLSGRMLAAMGWSKEQIQAYYAHSSPNTTQVYLEGDMRQPATRVAPDFNLAAAGKLDVRR